jgi:hypothetical protein
MILSNESSKKRIKIFPAFILCLLLIMIYGQQNIFAAARTWTGNVSTDWADASNWTPAGIPGTGDDITIPTAPTGGRMPTISSDTAATKKLIIQTGATLTQTGGQLTTSDAITISGTFDQQGGTFLTTSNVTVTSSGQINQSGFGIIHLSANLANTPTSKLTIDGGTVNAAGTIRVKYLELKNGGTFNQTDGEFVVYNDFKCSSGAAFASTGGTVRFAGSGAVGADFRGNVQLHNVIIDSGADPKFDNNSGQTVKISGNYTNNNTALDVTKMTFIFNGSGDQTIYSASTPLPGTTTFGSLVIDKPSGSISLLSNVAVENSFTQTSGNLDENGYTFWVAGNPLPVELSSFSAVILKDGVKLKWRTETEVSNYGFEILRSAQNDIWDVLGFVQGHGNSNSPKEYSFIDENVTEGKYSYRLKQLDTDGNFEFSKIIEIDLGTPQRFELSQNYPNPFNPVTTIKYVLIEPGKVRLTVFNPLGEEVAALVDDFKEAGVHTVNFIASSLISGVYIYKLENAGYILSRKMILLK